MSTANMINTDFFYGDGERGENAQDFLKKIKRLFITQNWDDVKKIEYFETCLKANSPADEWYEALPAASKETWAKLRASFETKWPPKKATGQTTAEKRAKLEECTLREDELGTKVKSDDREEHAHVVWADKIQRLATAIPDNDGLLIASTRRTMPATLRTLVNDQHTSWKSFCDAIRAISVSTITDQKEVEKDRNDLKRMRADMDRERIRGDMERDRMRAEMEGERIRRLQDTPSKAIAASMRTMNVGPIEPLRYGPRAPMFQPAPAAQQQNNFPYQQRNDSERLQDLTRNAKPAHPDTPAGRAMYQADLTAWNAANPNRGPSETRPYPLTPGTAPVASGECWKCGQPGHMGTACMSTNHVPPAEEKWRAIAAGIKSRVNKAQAVNYIGGEIMVSQTEYDREVIERWMMSEEYSRLQGKGQGSST
jgi:hypothetical protein